MAALELDHLAVPLAMFPAIIRQASATQNLRQNLLAVGKAIEAETRVEIAEKPRVESPVDHMIVGIDGAFVKATRSKNQRRNFEIVLGRIEARGRGEKIFAAVRDLDDLARERVRSALRSAECGPATELTVLSDGEDAMRLMAGQWQNGRVEHRLDWFHLRRRIQWLGRSINWAIDYDDPACEERLARYRRNLRSVRWNVWHYGKSRHKRWMIALSRLGAQLRSHRNEIDAADGDLSKIEAACKRFDELEGYLYSNIGSLTDYGWAWRQGERIATANIESTANQLINQRMCKKRQMRWSRLGAQLSFMSGLLISMEISNATAACRSQLNGRGPARTSFGTLPDPQLLSGLSQDGSRHTAI
jgi:hypothetical protein